MDQSFENVFTKDKTFYEKQTSDEEQLLLLLQSLNIKGNEKVLDLGCGLGYVTKAIGEKYPNTKIEGYDVIKSIIDKNNEDNKLSNVSYHLYDGENLGFLYQEYDIIVSRYAIHHINHFPFVFKTLVSKLKKNGKFMIIDPTIDILDIDRFIDKFMQMKKDNHIKFYTKDELVFLAKSNNLRFSLYIPTSIRFPRKNPEDYSSLLKNNSMAKNIYDIRIIDELIYITIPVNILMFTKID